MADKNKNNFLWIGIVIVVFILSFVFISNVNKLRDDYLSGKYCVERNIGQSWYYLYNSSVEQSSYKLKELRYFCVMDYCETPQSETGYKSAKTAMEKEEQMILFCAELREEFNEACKPDRSNWGDFCFIRNERIEMLCNE